jgi:hypothetical protein
VHSNRAPVAQELRLNCERATMLRAGDAVRAIDPNDEPTGETGEIRWRGELAPGVEGVVAWFGACGNWGECVQGVFAVCDHDRLLPLTAVDYIYELEIGDAVDGWATVVTWSRGAERSDDPIGAVMTFDAKTQRYR